MRPLIGITTYHVKDRELGKDRVRGFPGQDMIMGTLDYSISLERAGGIPIPIPVIENSEEYMDEIIGHIDGLIFTGGPDIHPTKYNQSQKKGLGLVVPERDEFEIGLLKRALKKNKAILGICRGFQLINIYFGGSLHQDISSNKVLEIEHAAMSTPRYSHCHRVRIDEESMLFDVYNSNNIMVNSLHHQAIDRLGEGLRETAWSEDGLIEGIQHKKFPFVMGVQWHPEMMAQVYPEQMKIFKFLIEYSKKKGGEK